MAAVFVRQSERVKSWQFRWTRRCRKEGRYHSEYVFTDEETIRPVTTTERDERKDMRWKKTALQGRAERGPLTVRSTGI